MKKTTLTITITLLTCFVMYQGDVADRTRLGEAAADLGQHWLV